MHSDSFRLVVDVSAPDCPLLTGDVRLARPWPGPRDRTGPIEREQAYLASAPTTPQETPHVNLEERRCPSEISFDS
ncbi:hypothetical protein [Candidatus Poriferisocius sp.]|uniref:hypothetical protein n=1 Tax=Candidatus Poriferisocius sp. TaxID=3101276 RepID=UPI003B02AFF4